MLRAEQTRTSGTRAFQGPETPWQDELGRSDVFGLATSITHICAPALENWMPPGINPSQGWTKYLPTAASRNGYSQQLVTAIRLARMSPVVERPTPANLLVHLADLCVKARPVFEPMPAWAAPEQPMYVNTPAARRTYFGLRGIEEEYYQERNQQPAGGGNNGAGGAAGSAAGTPESLTDELANLDPGDLREFNDAVDDPVGEGQAAAAASLAGQGGVGLVNVLLKFRRSDFGSIEVRDNTIEEVEDIAGYS
jgi:hypothetical protein